MKIPKFTKLKFDPEAERRACAPAVDSWRVECPHLAKAYDAAISDARGERIKLQDFARIARRYKRRRGKGLPDDKRDALARSPTGGGRFADGGKGDWSSDHQSATRSGDLNDPMYDPEDDLGDTCDAKDDPEDTYDTEDDPEDTYDTEDDPEDTYDTEDDPVRRLILPMKNKLAADATVVAYSVAPHSTPVVAWTAEPVIITADEALASEGRDGDGQERKRPERDDAIKWLRNLLTDGPCGAKQVQNEARAAGISIATLRRAKAEIPIDTYLEGFGPTGTWVWRLRDAQAPTGR